MTNYSASCLISKLDHILSSLADETSGSKTTVGDRIIVKHFKGILIDNYAKNEYITVHDLYFDTSTNILYIVLDHQEYMSTMEVDPNLPFHKGLSFVNKIDWKESTVRIKEIDINITQCYNFPFMHTSDGTIIDGYTIHEFDKDNRQYHYTPITYEHIKTLFQTICDGQYVRRSEGKQEYHIGDTESYIILRNKLIIRSDLSYCTYYLTDYRKGHWKLNKESNTKLERRSQLISLIGQNGGWDLIEKLKANNQFEIIMGPEIVYD